MYVQHKDTASPLLSVSFWKQNTTHMFMLKLNVTKEGDVFNGPFPSLISTMLDLKDSSA